MAIEDNYYQHGSTGATGVDTPAHLINAWMGSQGMTQADLFSKYGIAKDVKKGYDLGWAQINNNPALFNQILSNIGQDASSLKASLSGTKTVSGSSKYGIDNSGMAGISTGNTYQAADGTYFKTQAEAAAYNAKKAPKPVTTLSSVSGQKIANTNIQKLQTMQSSYAGPSIVDYLKSVQQPSDFGSRGKLAGEAGIQNYTGTAQQNTQLLNLLRTPAGNPAQAHITDSVNQSMQGGNATPQQRQGYADAQDLQGSIFGDMSLAEAAKGAGNYSQMDYLIKRAEENSQKLNDQLQGLYGEMRPLRERQLDLMTPGAKEQELAKQVNNIKGQIDQFKIQTEEDKFREFEGQTLGFAGGRASEIDIRAQFKLQRMATEANTLINELGLEQNAREMEGKSVEQQLKYLADDFELQQNVQDKITEIEDSVFEAAKGLRSEAKDTLGMILDSMQGVNPDEIPMHPIEALEAVSPGMKILFDDGNIISEVIETHEKSVTIEIQNEGVLKSGKSINMTGAHLDLPSMTKKDLIDLKFGCDHDIDIVAASFIRSSHHVLSIKDFLTKEGKSEIQVIAKIENKHGVENFDSIVQVADGIMVARGDLGVEVDLALVPKLQKMMIRKCYQACKPSITATQMLESMISNPRPTRAEVSDVANAIYDSTSAIMLSGESAIGKYPIETVSRMRSIAKEAESDFPYRLFFEQHSQRDYHDLSSAVAMAAVKTAYSANAKAIFAFTTSGATARFVSRLRPEMPIIAVTSQEKVYHQLASNWGVLPVLCPGCSNAKEAFASASHYALEKKFISFGDVVVVTAGVPFGKKGTTNMMTVESIGEVLVRGHKGFGPKVTGKITILLSSESQHPKSLEGKIVVISHCDNSFLPVLKHAAGVILQNCIGDTGSEKYAVLLSKTFEISVMSRADGAMRVLQEGEEVTLDPQRGLVYRGGEEAVSCPVFSL